MAPKKGAKAKAKAQARAQAAQPDPGAKPKGEQDASASEPLVNLAAREALDAAIQVIKKSKKWSARPPAGISTYPLFPDDWTGEQVPQHQAGMSCQCMLSHEP